MYLSIFFFQAEDGIRDDLVTGVQTCALPILFESPGFVTRLIATLWHLPKHRNARSKPRIENDRDWSALSRRRVTCGFGSDRRHNAPTAGYLRQRDTDFEGTAVVRDQPAPARACSRSPIRSAASSIPTDSRRRSAGAGDSGPSIEARCSIRLSTPPSDVARFQTATRAAVAIAALSPPATRMLSMPPKPPDIWRAATA